MTSPLEKRLTAQVHSAKLAHSLLLERKHIKPNGELTAEGKKRQALGDSGRAKDRAAKYSGHHTPKEYKYVAATNSAKLKRKTNGR